MPSFIPSSRLDSLTYTHTQPYYIIVNTILSSILQVDRDTARLNGDVENEIFDLFASLDATDEQLDFPIIYASAKYVSVFGTYLAGEITYNT